MTKITMKILQISLQSLNKKREKKNTPTRIYDNLYRARNSNINYTMAPSLNKMDKLLREKN